MAYAEMNCKTISIQLNTDSIESVISEYDCEQYFRNDQLKQQKPILKKKIDMWNCKIQPLTRCVGLTFLKRGSPAFLG